MQMINYEKYPLQDDYFGKYLSIADSMTLAGGSPGGDDGEYDWTLPDTQASGCKIRVSDASDGDPSDESGAFSVTQIDSGYKIILDMAGWGEGLDEGFRYEGVCSSPWVRVAKEPRS